MVAPPLIPPPIYTAPTNGSEELSGWGLLGALGLGVVGAALFFLLVYLAERSDRRKRES